MSMPPRDSGSAKPVNFAKFRRSPTYQKSNPRNASRNAVGYSCLVATESKVMRDKTVEKWQQRIQRAAALLGSKLEEPPSLHELAGAAAISPYHFHRIWRAMTGRTVGEMVRHLRIKEASRVLVESDASVTEIALSLGFATSQNFARAFRQELGVSPSSFRAGYRGQSDAGAKRSEATEAPIELVFVDSRTVIAKRRTGLPYEALNEEFGTVWSWAERSGVIGRLNGIYGVPYDDPLSVPVAALRYDACLALGGVTEAPHPLHALVLAGGECARLRVRGSYAQLEGAIQSLVGGWLLNSGREPADAPLFHHFHNDPDSTAEADLVTDIFLPLLSHEERS
jgi:AraC family transcriptional regulator